MAGGGCTETRKLEGAVLCVKRGDDIPPMHNMSIFLPRSADKSSDYAFGLLRAQNVGLNTPAWRVISSAIEDNGLRLNVGIDEDSYCSVRRAGYKLNYRFSFVTMRPWRQKAADEKEEGEEEIKVDGNPLLQRRQRARRPISLNLKPNLRVQEVPVSRVPRLSCRGKSPLHRSCWRV